MWIVAYALRRPYTIAVMAILALLLGLGAARRMPTDILPGIDIPAITVVWTYQGLNPQEMAAKVTSFSEISILNNVDNVRSVASETSNGVGIVKVEFQPEVEIDLALAQVTGVSQTILRRMPAGMTPPLVVRSQTGSVPIIQLALSSDSMTESQLYDYARLALRGQIQSIPGVRLTLPYGGTARQIMVDLDPDRMRSYGLTPADVSRAVAAQNLTLPSGTLREDGREAYVSLNGGPETVESFNNLPLRAVDGRVLFLRDVANVRDGGAPQTNVARVDGAAGVTVSLMKLGDASTVEIVDQLLAKLPEMRAAAPEGMRIEPIFDQSLFVRAAVDAVLHEGALVAALVGVLVLVFLGSARSTAIVLTSIPLSIMVAVAGLNALGHTLNLMTLGGLMLAIGILVDNAMVEIENTNRNIAMGKSVRQAVLDSAQQVVFPEFVSTLCICIVFVPVFMMTGISAYVFRPLALAVVISMAASFILSRTLVPTLAFLLLPAEVAARAAGRGGWLEAMHHRVEHGLDKVRDGQVARVAWAARHRVVVLGLALVIVAGGLGVGAQLGRDFFPTVDAGTLRLHLRAPAGTRVEEAASLFADIQRDIRTIIPAAELGVVVENIGTSDPVNLAWVDSFTVTPGEGEMLIQLNPGHGPTPGYEQAIRAMLADRFPQVTALFRPADIVGQTLNGSAAAAIDVRIAGRDVAGNLAFVRQLAERVRREVPGAADVTLRQITDWPDVRVTVDRVRAAQLGVTMQDVANALLISLSGSGTVTPIYWADAGTSYIVAVQVPPDRIGRAEDVLNTPVRAAGAAGGQVLLRNLATITEQKTSASVSRATMMPLVNLLVGVAPGHDLAGVIAGVEGLVAEMRGTLKPGNTVTLQGQAAAMQAAYADLAGGLAVALLLVYLVMVVNFQSWALPLASMGAFPLAVAGAALGLAVTGTTISVPALMGLIMVVGVSTANSVLVVSFARDRLEQGAGVMEAALDAIRARIRPVLMTATAMLVGMLPMAVAMGEGGEQNAPLARAVIGGLLLATPATLTLVPILFTLLARRYASALATGARSIPAPVPAE
ncbi:efflux RND transporter permease subunit [Niveispirillum irakense]|uniref:efflux RND transporter permease subunit n=1 Tax=Niveispirillum irakense TaxID=34011 RepID=UPI00042857FC|nr:efflux RND transporter permease subunit [Niveispirillum irakense]